MAVGNGDCIFCSEAEETMDHLFIRCKSLAEFGIRCRQCDWPLQRILRWMRNWNGSLIAAKHIPFSDRFKTIVICDNNL